MPRPGRRTCWSPRAPAAARRERAGVELFLIDAKAAGITRRDYPTVDGFRASEVYFENVAIPGDALLPGGIDLIERDGRRRPRWRSAPKPPGSPARMVEQTVEYTQQRKQFGLPIAKFQVLQHRMSDMFCEAEQIASMALMGTLKLDEPAEQRKAAVSHGQGQGRARPRIWSGQNAIQTHGGIGITVELAIGHYFKRGDDDRTPVRLGRLPPRTL